MGVFGRSAVVRVPSWPRALALLGALTSACETADESVRTEIVPLAEGEFHGARWGGTQVERFYTVAWGGPPSAPDGTAVIVSAEHEQPCSLGTNVSRYTSIRPQTASKYVIGSPSPARITLLEDVDADGIGTLRFADVDCKRIDLSVPEVSNRLQSYVFQPDQTQQKIAVSTRAGAIIFVDPWKQEQHQIAENVRDFRTFETGEWLIEGDQLVKRDLEGEELMRRGKGVVSLLPLNGKGDLAYQEDSGIYTIRGGVTKRIAKNGCLSGNLEAFMPSAISYREEPCERDNFRTLHVAVGTDKTYTYGAGIIAMSIQPGTMFYTTLRDEKTQFFLVDAVDPMKPKLIGEYPTFALDGVMTLPSRITVVISREEDGTRTIWQLQRTGDGANLVELTRGIRRIGRAEMAIALLYDNGELILADGGIERVLMRVPNAQGSQFSFIMGGKALGLVYLDEVDPETGLGSLELQLLSGAHYSLAQDVREYEYVHWPERGLAYVRGGADPGISFARIEIPCEATSDAPWACGF
jgi:hypothetical protein